MSAPFVAALPRLELNRSDLVTGLAVAAAAGAAGYLVVRDPLTAGAVALAPLALLLLVKRRATAVLLGAALPFVQDFTRGRLGLNVSLSDLLLVLLFASVMLSAFVQRRMPQLRALAPLRLAVLPYLCFMAMLLAYHLGTGTTIKTGQRLELFLIPLVVGATVVIEGGYLWVLRGYIVSSTLLAAAWPFIVSGDQGLGIQKNPAGQFIANALLLMIAVKPLRRGLVICAPVLITGLLWTQSRGAIASVGVGLAVLLLMQVGISRKRLLLQLVPLTIVTLAAFHFLPETAQDRATTFSANTETSAGYALHYRELYRQDAWGLIHQHPWTGVGVGQYQAGSAAQYTLSTDPHQVLLLQAAEGGYLFAGLFIVLIATTLFTLFRRARRTELGAAAAAVTLAIASHGLVDVYWVRGTPVLGWLLVGMALAQVHERRSRT